MKYNLLNELKKEYEVSFENKMQWGMSQVDLIYDRVLEDVKEGASVGNRVVNISFNSIKRYLRDGISKDDGYFIIQSFIEKLNNDSYYTLTNKKRLSFDVGGWDTPWVNKDTYAEFRKAIMDGDCGYEKCRLKLLEYAYEGIQMSCRKAREMFCDDIDFRKIFGECYSDYLKLGESERNNLINEVRTKLDDSGICVSMFTGDSITMSGWAY